MADRRLRAFANQYTTRTIRALGVTAVFNCATSHELGRLLTFGGEPLILHALRRLQSRDTFYDIGANIGLYTVLAAKLVGPEGRVIAFEPESGNFARLQANALLNDLTQVVACPFALSDTASATNLRLHSQMVGEGGHAIATGGETKVTVFCLPLDTVVEVFGMRPAALVKIDVEGHEEAVLAGMSRALASPTLRTVVLEAHYYDQLADGRRYFYDDELRAKRGRMVTTLRGFGFRLHEERPLSEGPVRLSHMLFVRDAPECA